MTPPILLVRHGETDSNAARVVQLPDAHLSATGRQQADRLAVRIAQCGIAHILCSDMTRALETAAPVSARTGLAITADPLLRERDFGDLRGTPYDELRVDPFAADYAPPNGETLAEFHKRVERAWALVVQVASSIPGSLLVVTHGLVCRALVERRAARLLHPAPDRRQVYGAPQNHTTIFEPFAALEDFRRRIARPSAKAQALLSSAFVIDNQSRPLGCFGANLTRTPQ